MPINSFLYPGAKVTTGYDVANSCMFNDGDSPSMYKSGLSGGSTTIATVSAWIKRCTLGVDQRYYANYAGSGSDRFQIGWQTDDQLYIQHGNSVIFKTNRKFRDVSAWYHIVVAVDSSQASNDNRVKVYVNGTQETSFATFNTMTQDTEIFMNNDKIWIGQRETSSLYFDGYLAEVVQLDGTAANATSFGEFDEDSPRIWKPKDVSGLTFGTNGFYLDFEDSSNLGNDANGGTDFTEANLAAADQATDTPTNNFCTMNPLVGSTSHTFSEGNCKIVSSGSDTKGGGVGTFGLTAGKWYWEVKLGSLIANHTHGVVSELTSELYAAGGATGLSQDTGATTWRNDDGGEVVIDGTVTTADYGVMAEDSIMGIALDMDNHNISYYDDGSALVTDLNISTTRGTIFPLMSSGINCTVEVNFGGCSAFSISSAQSDENGYGNFEHAPPSGYLAICSKNLGSDGG